MSKLIGLIIVSSFFSFCFGQETNKNNGAISDRNKLLAEAIETLVSEGKNPQENPLNADSIEQKPVKKTVDTINDYAYKTSNGMNASDSLNRLLDTLVDYEKGSGIYKNANLTFFPEWTLIASTNDGYEFDLNKKPLNAKNGIVKIWVRMRIRPSFNTITRKRLENVRQLKNTKYEFYLYSKYLEEFDCNEKKIRTLSFIDYNEDGTALSSVELKNAEWSYIVPESIGEEKLNCACKKLKK